MLEEPLARRVSKWFDRADKQRRHHGLGQPDAFRPGPLLLERELGPCEVPGCREIRTGYVRYWWAETAGHQWYGTRTVLWQF